MKDLEKCPHCEATDISYFNYKHHLYMYCVDQKLLPIGVKLVISHSVQEYI